MEISGAGFRNHINGSAFATTVHRREALRTYDELLNCFEWKLHHRATDGVVLVIDAINRDVNIAATRTINAENRYTILSRIIRVDRLHSGS